MPLVSVVMPVYNAVETVEEAIRSLLRQTYEHLEILAVDDGSTDGTPDVIGGIRDARIRLLRQEHLGLVGALNAGCTLARGEYIARLDGDDIAAEPRIEAQLAYMEQHGEVGLLGTWARVVKEGEPPRIFAPPSSNAALRRCLLLDSPFVHSSVMFRREAYVESGGYPDGLNEDYRLWIRIARSWKVAVLPQVLVTHRVHAGSYTRSIRRRQMLRARLGTQWEATRALGPWLAAIPALGLTMVAYLLSLVGGGFEETVRTATAGLTARLRGFRRA
jgi:glycosyltransferase involved in cell wall biosynthesis